ncbi:MAG TPA: hypothetical protein PLF81_02710 [Candidatus Anammoximicrobium sp.]|nr:hypothetical protein [Candidatus Anammoximicrobium sp.]
MSIRATCSCGKAFLAIPELAGKVVKCPACGGALRVPQAAPTVPADDDPLGLGLQPHTDFRAPVRTPARSVLSTPATYATARPKKSGGGGMPPGLKIGLIVGGVVLASVVGLALLLALLLPAVQAAREAARRAAARSAGAQPGGGKWQTYTSPTGGYSISLPGTPQLRSQPMVSPIGVVTVSIAMVDLNRDGAYIASHVNTPPGGSWQATLDASMQEGLRNVNGQVVSSRNLTVAGSPAVESDFEGTKDGQAFCGRMQLVRAGATQYQLMFIGPKGTKPESDLQQFFSSFQLTRAAAPAPAPPAMPPAFAPPPTQPVTPPSFPPPPASPPPDLTAPESAPPVAPAPAKPGELNDAQRKSIYRALASYERLTEMSAKHADSMEQAGQHEAAARLRKSREEARQGLVRKLASGNGISEAQVEDIYQTGKRENWDR